MNKKHENDENSLKISQSQLQKIVIVMFLSIIFIFIAGYFWGKKTAQENLIKDYEQEAFADKIYTSLCSLCETEDEEEKAEKIEEGSEE
ncbi:MAG: hypothetical protein WA432_00060 [Candidatus Babeliaceae bacterium]